jgi:hypothetical protein
MENTREIWNATITLNCRRDPRHRGNQAEKPRKIRRFVPIFAAGVARLIWHFEFFAES